MTPEERLEICKECPLYKEDKFYGSICDHLRFISPDGKEWSYQRKEGWTPGCGCHLRHRVLNPNAKCVIGRW